MLALVPAVAFPTSDDLEPHRRFLWGICYRMTGVAADADELVQETFARALTSPPQDRSRELLPWLVRVATNASRDLLRRRKRERYEGPWLPSPVDDQAVDVASWPSARYGARESASYAFLRALEALSSSQRAIVLLRDVLDYSVAETAEALSISEANVKTSHHRARAKLEVYEREHQNADAAQLAKAQGAMTRFFAHLALEDVAGIERLLVPHAEGLNDGGGEFFAARVPVVSARLVARFFAHLGPKTRVTRAVPTTLNGLPALIADVVPYAPGVPPRAVNLFECDAEGRIVRIYGVVATRKISHLWVNG